ncbi:hypothetical protein T265_15630, partial [Opisthorchis viverrini]
MYSVTQLILCNTGLDSQSPVLEGNPIKPRWWSTSTDSVPSDPTLLIAGVPETDNHMTAIAVTTSLVRRVGKLCWRFHQLTILVFRFALALESDNDKTDEYIDHKERDQDDLNISLLWWSSSAEYATQDLDVFQSSLNILLTRLLKTPPQPTTGFALLGAHQ